MWMSGPHMPVYRTLTMTSSGPGAGTGTSSNQMPGSDLDFTSAFIGRTSCKTKSHPGEARIEVENGMVPSWPGLPRPSTPGRAKLFRDYDATAFDRTSALRDRRAPHGVDA